MAPDGKGRAPRLIVADKPPGDRSAGSNFLGTGENLGLLRPADEPMRLISARGGHMVVTPRFCAPNPPENRLRRPPERMLGGRDVVEVPKHMSRIMAAINATLRDGRSSYSITSLALCRQQTARAFSSSGRSSRLSRLEQSAARPRARSRPARTATRLRAIELAGQKFAIPGQDGVRRRHRGDLGASQPRR